MSSVKWIKITTDMFDNRKIKHLRRLPEGNNIVLIWVMLLTMAGRCNSGGMVFLTENIPYTPKMLADELDFEENTVRLALEALSQLGMIVMDSNYFSIAGWDEYQSADKLERMRENARLRKQRQREREALPPASRDCHVTVTQCHALEEDIEREEEKEKDIEGDTGPDDRRPGAVPYGEIKSMYNEICVSFPRCVSLSDARKKTIKARITSGYTLEDFKTLFTKAEASSFLKGKNDRSWSANFDWLIKDANMAKVLDGNYDDKGGGTRKTQGRTEPTPHWMAKYINQRDEPPKTVDDDPELRDRAERLRQSLTK
jgi:predicted phage replisome organizer